MTFPSPFESNPIPGLQGVAESLDLDAAEVQRIATALFQGALAPLEQDKRRLATIKGNLVKPVAASIKAQDSRTLTEIGQRLRQHAAAQVADGDAELMLLASRLGARQATGELVPVVQAAPTTATTAAVGDTIPADYQYQYGDCVPMNPFAVPPIDRNHPPTVSPCWRVTLRPDGSEAWCWTCPPDGGGGAPPPPPPPPAPPPPPPPYCEPCPVGVPPGGTLPAVTCPVGVPAAAVPQAVYQVPWLDGASDPSADSECGQKMIMDAAPGLDPARDLVAALQSPRWVTTYLGSGRISGTPPLPVEPVITDSTSLGFLEGGE